MAKTASQTEAAETAKEVFDGEGPGDLEELRIEPVNGGHVVHERFRPKRTKGKGGEAVPSYEPSRKPTVFKTAEEVRDHVYNRLSKGKK